MLGRFVQEAKILEKLDHPNISRPLAWDADGEDVFLAMEFIDGETLDTKFAGNSQDNSPVPFEGIAWICDQLASAMEYAHQNGIVHRDLKPKNVMVNRRGQRPFLKVLDFGIAKMLVGSELDPTTVGRVLGSVLYISPEQVLGRELSPRADIFSMGTILFELTALKRAWARDEDGGLLAFHKSVPQGPKNSHVAVLRRIAREERPLARSARPELPAAVDQVLHRAMAIQPEDRFFTASEFASALRAALIEEHPTASSQAPEAQSEESETLRMEAPPREDPPTEAVSMRLVLGVAMLLAAAVVIALVMLSGRG
jgi:eukaryotic-like serine/threonine-protein kinase